jgi:hypothetical protein
MITSTNQKILDIFQVGRYRTTTTYSKKLNREYRIGVATITAERDNLDKDGVSIAIIHSGENGHYEKMCLHLDNSGVTKLHTSNMTGASHSGNELYFSKSKRLVSIGTGFSHINKSIIEFKRFYSKTAGGSIMVKSYIKKNSYDSFLLQSITRLTPC